MCIRDRELVANYDAYLHLAEEIVEEELANNRVKVTDHLELEKQARAMHGFIIACDPWMRPNETVLIVNKDNKLLGLGRSQSTVSEMKSFRKGIAVRVREGCP